MKRLMFAVMAILLMSGVARADLSIDWQNDDIAVSTNGTMDGIINDNLVQLLWSATGNTTNAGAYPVFGGATQAGEFVLASTTIHSGYGLWDRIQGTYTSANVGGADIHSGVFFTRIFETPGAEIGTSFYDVNVVDASEWVFDPLDPVSIYTENAISANTSLNPGDILDVRTNGTTVIPEPGTFYLMIVTWLGLLMVRRITRR